MTWLLDTNVCIRYLNGRAPKLRDRIDSTTEADIAVCSVVKAELFFGAAMSTEPAKTLANQKRFLSRFQSLVFDDRCGEVYGEIRAELTRKGKPVGPNDMLIASIAKANGSTLVTHNVTEFSRINGLQTEDWETG
jgi:tRNA(fMet)-specific endonuclease VapC